MLYVLYIYQPGSAISAGSGSITSSGSRRAKTKHYRAVAANSQVDESLFGTPHREQRRQQMLDRQLGEIPEVTIEREARERIIKRSAGKNKKPARETVQVITKDLIRNLM